MRTPSLLRSDTLVTEGWKHRKILKWSQFIQLVSEAAARPDSCRQEAKPVGMFAHVVKVEL